MNQLIASTNTKKLHLPYLDGLRGIASLYVLLVHIEPSVGEQLPALFEIFLKTLRYGRISVVVFIVLSGYVLMLPIVRSDGYVSGGLLGYIKRRSRRILPPFYATLFFCLLLAGAVFALETFTSFRWDKVAGVGPFFPKFSVRDFLAHLLLIHNLSPDTYMSINPPMWTVATEWQLYFILPLLLLPIWRRFGLAPTVVTAFLIGIAPLYLLNGLFETASPWFLGLFALGMASADIGFSQKPKLMAMKKSLPWGVFAIIFTCVAFLTEWKSLGLHIWINESLFGIGTACLFIYSTELLVNTKKLPLILQIFEYPWAIALGTFSYSLYLIHGPVLVLVRYFLFNRQMSPLMFGVTSYLLEVPISLLVAYLFYLVFERPFMSNPLKNVKLKMQSVDIKRRII
ncbi:MAG: acyltransferase [Cyanomargarita calcarea GSE-NOS-MK-12-04C]|jgi:peptidoglycan/LPS O-acetylase OafA/YrhL|uniref:Acyltransferase n=1 Tax=Cyanomargarita calcarea GSE-NOS-MK-12-04C TaxID=2839659 RepID=A0A951QMN5_9CYAN|nr:acyltransferase [Cyanomargarita calcarea GSE-NOS-MK-12-04C]